MTEEELRALLRGLRGADVRAKEEAARYVRTLAAPPGSLGALADAAVQLAGITGRVKNSVDRRRVIVLCADNGVVREGVSVTPPSVTLAQAVNMTKYRTGMSVLAKHFGCEVQVVDVGIDADIPAPEAGGAWTGGVKSTCGNAAGGGPGDPAEGELPPQEVSRAHGGILPLKIRRGTGDILREPAMTREEAVAAVCVGIGLARRAAAEGIEGIGVGEMGIGNTTTSSAVLAALTGMPAREVTGRGGGLTDAALEHKTEVIERALALHRPDPGDPVGVLAKVGGLDIAAMCGVFLGAALCRIPAVIDGFISIVAALCAVRLCPAVRDFLFPSHASAEPGYRRAAQELGLQPWLCLGMRLGEGSGCPLAFQVLSASCALMREMATFAEARIDDGYLAKLREKE